MGGCQNYGPFLGTLNIRCRIILGTQKGTIILTTTQIAPSGAQHTAPPRIEVLELTEIRGPQAYGSEEQNSMVFMPRTDIELFHGEDRVM